MDPVSVVRVVRCTCSKHEVFCGTQFLAACKHVLELLYFSTLLGSKRAGQQRSLRVGARTASGHRSSKPGPKQEPPHATVALGAHSSRGLTSTATQTLHTVERLAHRRSVDSAVSTAIKGAVNSPGRWLPHCDTGPLADQN